MVINGDQQLFELLINMVPSTFEDCYLLITHFLRIISSSQLHFCDDQQLLRVISGDEPLSEAMCCDKQFYRLIYNVYPL